MADDLDASVAFSSPDGPLVVPTDGAYRLVELGVTPRRWRRNTVEGRYQHGRALVGAVLEQGLLTVRVVALGASWVAAANRLDELTAVVSQHRYTATVTVAGRVDVWTCEPADMALADRETWEKHMLMASQQEYVLSIPVSPR